MSTLAPKLPDATQRKNVIRMFAHGGMLGFIIAFILSVSSSYAQGTPSACVADEAHCRLVGNFSAVSVANPNQNGQGITSPNSSAFGGLVYVDFIKIEEEARDHLSRAVGVRESLSPYQGKVGFDEFLAKMDSDAGLTQVYNQTTPYGSGLTRNQLINRVESDLNLARTRYAFLAVFAPEARFRQDNSYTAGGNSLCGTTNKEDANPEDLSHEGHVFAPVVDWCDFKARLRQSVREAANIRMMVGQQFMVDALGMNFSSTTKGGEVFVKREVAQLRAAQYQFKRAEQNLSAALTERVGDGCFLSDFYSESEWSLLTSAADSQSSTQFLVATRLSYLDDNPTMNLASYNEAKDAAITAYRTGATDGYLKMVGLSALGRSDLGHCDHGEHPGDTEVASMAINLLNAQHQAHDLVAGRNIFGFSVAFTPNAPYKSSTTADCNTNAVGDRGLWDAANCAQIAAAKAQDSAEQAQRDFDGSQEALITAATDLIDKLDKDIDNTVGCTRRPTGNDEEFFDCASTQINRGLACIKLIETDFYDPCVNNEKLINQANDATTALHDLRSAYLEWQSILLSMNNIDQRVQQSNDANAEVTYWIGANGIAQTIASATSAALDTVACGDFSNPEGAIASAIVCGGAGTLNGAAQIAAGATSIVADVKMQDADNNKEVQGLLLDQSELMIAANSAKEAYNSKLSDTIGIYTALQRDVDEDIHRHAYFKSGPANNPAFRIVRDSRRLLAADALEVAAKLSYLAARRAEYEYATRLAASGFSISDIYRARTPQDIFLYLDKLRHITERLPGSTLQQIQPLNFTISIARDIVPDNDDASLIKDGFTTPQQIQAERLRRFRNWVASNTIKDEETGKNVLHFTMPTSLLKGGTFDNLLSKSDLRWRMMLGEVGVNVASDQKDLSRRTVQITQGGVLHLRSFAGCVFDYHLIEPAVMMGYEWAKSQNPEEVPSLFNADVNNTHADTDSGFFTDAFQGRAISATDWEVSLFASEAGLPEMQLQQLQDVELQMNAFFIARKAGAPQAGECSRLDF